MKSRLEEIVAINAILQTRSHNHSDLIRTANTVALLNHHMIDNFTPEAKLVFATCRNCKAEVCIRFNAADQQVTGSASEFTCEQVQAMRRKGK